ncbi:MAG: hypothetical protein MHM6MM_003965 [Cercozoa sp. M6MM]
MPVVAFHSAIVYGATTPLGERVVRRLLRNGITPVLAGPSLETLTVLRGRCKQSLTVLDFVLAELQEVRRQLRQCKSVCVLQCVDLSFEETRVLVEACLHTQKHWLHACLLPAHKEKVAARVACEFADRAESLGVLLMSGLSYNELPPRFLSLHARRLVCDYFRRHYTGNPLCDQDADNSDANVSAKPPQEEEVDLKESDFFDDVDIVDLTGAFDGVSDDHARSDGDTVGLHSDTMCDMYDDHLQVSVCIAAFNDGSRSSLQALRSALLSLAAYIYIFRCVCVCACVCSDENREPPFLRESTFLLPPPASRPWRTLCVQQAPDRFAQVDWYHACVLLAANSTLGRLVLSSNFIQSYLQNVEVNAEEARDERLLLRARAHLGHCTKVTHMVIPPALQTTELCLAEAVRRVAAGDFRVGHRAAVECWGERFLSEVPDLHCDIGDFDLN